MSGLSNLLNFVVSHPLNRGARLAAILRVIRWQLGSRFLPAGAALPFVQGTHLFVTRGMTGATGNWYCGLHETNDMGLVLHALRPDELFVDVGANIGSYTILAAGAVGADTIAIEPVPATFAALGRNVFLNDLHDRVRCMNIGLGDAAGELRFTSAQDTTNHVLAEGEGEAFVTVNVLPLDEVCADRTPLIIKIDVEGYEHAVIAGGQSTLASPSLQVVIMETNGSGLRYGWDDAQLVDTMREFGFTTCSYDPILRRLESAAPSETSNTLFVRDVAAMQERVSQAARFQLVNGDI
ncbi:FkbM family methyltransferase [Haliea sp. E1-2-M8]|uniref:FkbM family methyltransferase n=1 Tax=Haliea sp. E1-2-M8 TaxID=3064706 RepID=UPI002717C25D|nr:FkbM family methyltransferase [Haliea sp. E1-2-M8]MDO8864170.1 FkbM family methyltransferase [Haliea sp. E1-2-M8]